MIMLSFDRLVTDLDGNAIFEGRSSNGIQNMVRSGRRMRIFILVRSQSDERTRGMTPRILHSQRSLTGGLVLVVGWAAADVLLLLRAVSAEPLIIESRKIERSVK